MYIYHHLFFSEIKLFSHLYLDCHKTLHERYNAWLLNFRTDINNKLKLCPIRIDRKYNLLDCMLIGDVSNWDVEFI